MRKVVSSMPCVSALVVMCLTSLSGCGKVPDGTLQSRSSSPSMSASPTEQPAEKIQTPTSTTESSVILAERAKTDTAVKTPQESKPTTFVQQQSESVAATPSESAETPAAEEAPPKPKRKPIYDETADAKQLIAKAVQRAKRDHKQVLIEWGGNWCGWCHLLHDCFTKVPEVAKIVYEEYELVLIDSGSNTDLMKEYAANHSIKGFPHLTIINADGKVLTNQDTEPLEKGKGHDPELVTKFLSEWMLPKVDAEQLLSETFEKAKQDNKQVLFRVDDPYCGWCKVLSQFIQDHESLFAKDYVDVKIDTTRMTNGEKVSESHRPLAAQGHPWFIILDSAGASLATSVGQKGNIGYPSAPEEIDHFMKMLRDTRKSITDDELASIETDLNEHRIQMEKKQAERKHSEQSSN